MGLRSRPRVRAPRTPAGPGGAIAGVLVSLRAQSRGLCSGWSARPTGESSASGATASNSAPSSSPGAWSAARASRHRQSTRWARRSPLSAKASRSPSPRLRRPGKLFQDLAPAAGDGLLSAGESVVADRVDPLVVPRHHVLRVRRQCPQGAAVHGGHEAVRQCRAGRTSRGPSADGGAAEAPFVAELREEVDAEVLAEGDEGIVLRPLAHGQAGLSGVPRSCASARTRPRRAVAVPPCAGRPRRRRTRRRRPRVGGRRRGRVFRRRGARAARTPPRSR